jgi:hypothetical protein
MFLVYVQEHSSKLIMTALRMWSTYATPQPWHVLIPWCPDHVIFPPSHLVILAFHIHINISMQVPCQSVESFARNPPIYSYWFSPIIPSIISSSFIHHLCLVLSSKPWRKVQKYLGKYSLSIDPNPPKFRSNFHSKSSFEFNEVNWIQIRWTKYSFEIQILALDFKNILGLKSLIWIWILWPNSKFSYLERV